MRSDKGKRLRRIAGYFRSNLGVPFIVAFLLLMLSGGIILAYQATFGMDYVRQRSSFFNVIGVCSYFLILAGVILQLISYKYCHRSKNDEEVG